MTPAAQTATREMQAKSTETHMERARLEGVLCALCEVAGFEATVAAVQGALGVLNGAGIDLVPVYRDARQGVLAEAEAVFSGAGERA